jgi:cytochrome c556
MKRIVQGAGLLGVGVAAMLAVTARAEEERTLSIRAVMHKQYTASSAPFLRIKKELDSEAPDWGKVRDSARTFVALAEVLQKNEPKWGSKESWKTFTDRHYADAKALDAAAEARGTEKVRAIHRRLAAACKACHDAHRFRAGGPRPPG